MKNYLIVGALALFAFQACEKSGEKPAEPLEFVTVGLTDNIQISDVEGYDISKVTDIALVARFHSMGSYPASTMNDAGEDTRVMLRGIPFDSETMTLELPSDPPRELLRPIASDFPEGFTISDTDAKTVAWVEIACNLTEDNDFHMFLHRYLNAGGGVYYEVKYIYCDRPVTVTGTAPDWWGHTTTYDLSLEKGWNMYVEKDYWTATSRTEMTRSQTINHQMPVTIVWQQSMWIGER